jgi:hypothetical protein
MLASGMSAFDYGFIADRIFNMVMSPIFTECLKHAPMTNHRLFTEQLAMFTRMERTIQNGFAK